MTNNRCFKGFLLAATFAGSIMLSSVMLYSCAAKNALPEGTKEITLTPKGQFKAGPFGEGAAEIVDYNPDNHFVYFTDSAGKQFQILDISDPTSIRSVNKISIERYGKNLNSIAVKGNLVAVAVEANPKQKRGKVVFFSKDGRFIKSVRVGALPDMLIFSPDGKYLVVANEGEPDKSYKKDPKGSISIISIVNDMPKDIKTLDFEFFKKVDLDASTRIAKPGSSPFRDFEPEYIAISKDSKKAFVTLQENNAVAIVDLEHGVILNVVGLGFKDHMKPGNTFDSSDKSKGIDFKNWPVFGMYQPDSIVSFEVNGKTFLATANEGDSKDYDGWSEETRVGKLKLDPKAFPNAEELQKKENLGRLKTTKSMGDSNNDGLYEKIFSYGARSFSILDDEGKMIFDSGDFIERKLAQLNPEFFNSSDDENKLKNRSDDKGPEPEGLAVGMVKGKIYLFVGLERDGGIMVFNVSDPSKPEYVTYCTTRNYSVDIKSDQAGDLAPEGLKFIPAEKSPNGKALLAVAYEVSGTVRIFQID